MSIVGTTKAPKFLDLKESIDESCAPIYHTAEFGRTPYAPFAILCPICSNTACTLDPDRSFTVEGLTGNDVDITVDSSLVRSMGSKSGAPGVWIPMLCGNDPLHRFTICFDTTEANGPLLMRCHIQDDTYEALFP